MGEVIPLRPVAKKRKAKFTRGKIVALNSGGYLMTVRSSKETPDGRLYSCDYYDDQGEEKLGQYYEEQLHHPKDSPQTPKEPD